MLYIFQVDTGSMLTFDMTLAMETVSRLQQAIGKVYRIPADKQVLLISGGENLDPKAIVGSYHAGTDTNPIFLFSKHSIESATAPSASVNYGSQIDVQDQVEASIKMPVSYETVVARTQLAMDIQDVATSELAACERIVHDQHLQHQGWAAVIANLEDITSAFNARTKLFETNYNEYLISRDFYMGILSDFPTTLNLLGKIPLLECLGAEGIGIPATRSSSSSADSVASKRTISPISESLSDPQKPRTLLEWISAQDSRHTLNEMAHKCSVSLQQFDSSVQQGLLREVSEVTSHLDNNDMKQVKGLEDRLFSLEQIIHQAKLTVQEQKDMAQGFLQNQTRAQNLQDPSVLPDLCNSHKRQLLVMIKNHQKLKIVKKQCAATKEELAQNLHTRLRWVMFVEKLICDVDSRLVIHHETLKKLKRKLEIIMQMHNAPELYAKAVVEVVRRKAYTTMFLRWAESLAEERSNAHLKEVEKREVFLEKMRHHFLQALFPGIEEFPPPFAITAPKRFDDQLPEIQPEDILFLRDKVPELADKLRLPDPVDPTSSETIKAADDHDTIPVPTLKGDTTTHSYDPACSDIVILESEDQEEEKIEEKEEPDPEQFFSMGKPMDLHPLSVSEPVPMPRMALCAASQEQVLAAPSPPFALSPAVTKENLSKSSGAAITAPFHPSVPTIDISGKTTVDKGVQMEPLNLSEELESPEGPPTKIEKRDLTGKSPSQTSPCLDEYASEGFTTADFYIDESMPSSMTESNTKKITELQQIIQEKSCLLDIRERELEEQRRTVEELKPKLQKAKESFKFLQDVAEKGTLQLKCELLSLEKQASKDKDEFLQYMMTVTGKLLETITTFEKSQAEQWQNTIDNLKTEYSAQQIQWEEKLDLEVQKLYDTQSQLELYEKKLRDKEEEVEQVRTDLTKQMNERATKADQDIAQAKSQLCLEHELELEKVQSELSTELETKESELARLEEDVEENVATIKKLEEELKVMGDKLKADFEEEKEIIIEKIQNECQQVCKNVEVKLKEEMTKEHEKELSKLSQQHEEEIKQKCDNVTETLQRLHSEEMDKTMALLKEEFQEKLANVQKELMQEREEQVTKLNAAHAELQSQVHDLQDIKAKLEKEKEELSELYNVEKENLTQQHEEAAKNMISLQKHSDVIAELKTTLQTEKEEEVAKVRAELAAAHSEELESVMRRSQQEKQDSLSLMQSSLTAEKQVLFNEALNKAVSDKEKVIDEMRRREEQLLEENHTQRELVEQLQQQLQQQQQQFEQKEQQAAAEAVDDESEQALTRDKDKEARLIQQRLEEELTKAQKHILLLQSELQQSRLQASMMQSVAPIADLPTDHPRIQELEQVQFESRPHYTRSTYPLQAQSMADKTQLRPSAHNSTPQPPSSCQPWMTQSLKGSGIPGYVSTAGSYMHQNCNAINNKESMSHSLWGSGLPGYVSPSWNSSPTKSSRCTSPSKVVSPTKLGAIPCFRDASSPVRFPSPVVYASQNTAEAQKREMIRSMQKDSAEMPTKSLTVEQQRLLHSAASEEQSGEARREFQKVIPASVQQTVVLGVVQQASLTSQSCSPGFVPYNLQMPLTSPRIDNQQYYSPPGRMELPLRYPMQQTWSPIESPVPFEYVYSPLSDSDGSDFEPLTPRDGSPWEHGKVYGTPQDGNPWEHGKVYGTPQDGSPWEYGKIYGTPQDGSPWEHGKVYGTPQDGSPWEHGKVYGKVDFGGEEGESSFGPGTWIDRNYRNIDQSFAVLGEESAAVASDMKEEANLVKSKEEELSSVVEKMNELCMTTSTRGLVTDKVSITTCNKGDIVLLCLDERHDHYVVFTVGTTLHFLHSDCLDTLGLKTPPGQTKKSWVLAEIMEKEYCQAKKPNNRFKVPVGTKFYRVKARPWEKERSVAAAAAAGTSREPTELMQASSTASR